MRVQIWPGSQSNPRSKGLVLISGHPQVQAERKETHSVTPGQLQGPLELNQSRVVFLCLSSNSFQGFIFYIYLGSCARKIFHPSLHFPFPSGSSQPCLPPKRGFHYFQPQIMKVRQALAPPASCQTQRNSQDLQCYYC